MTKTSAKKGKNAPKTKKVPNHAFKVGQKVRLVDVDDFCYVSKDDIAEIVEVGTTRIKIQRITYNGEDRTDVHRNTELVYIQEDGWYSASLFDMMKNCAQFTEGD